MNFGIHRCRSGFNRDRLWQEGGAVHEWQHEYTNGEFVL